MPGRPAPPGQIHRSSLPGIVVVVLAFLFGGTSHGTGGGGDAQIAAADLAASTKQLSAEAKNDEPTSSEVVNWATIFEIVIALGVLGNVRG